MKKTTTIIALLCAFAAPAMAQTALPYRTGFDTPAETAGWQQFQRGAVDPMLPKWVYTTASPYSPTQCLAHSYPVGGTLATDNWFVSPEFNFKDGATLDSVRRSFAGFGMPGTGDTVAIYLLTGNADPVLASTRKILFDFRGADYTNDNVWKKVAPIDIPATTGKCYIAIRYKTIVNWLDVKFDNLSLTSKATTGIDPIHQRESRIRCYPNPAKDMLYIQTDLDIISSKIFDLSGRLVYEQPFRSEIVLTQLAQGSYVMQSVLRDGSAVINRIIKQ